MSSGCRRAEQAAPLPDEARASKAGQAESGSRHLCCCRHRHALGPGAGEAAAAAANTTETQDRFLEVQPLIVAPPLAGEGWGQGATDMQCGQFEGGLVSAAGFCAASAQHCKQLVCHALVAGAHGFSRVIDEAKGQMAVQMHGEPRPTHMAGHEPYMLNVCR